MPRYDYLCPNCGDECERQSTISQRKHQRCDQCDTVLDQIYKPQPHYKPFHGYFDIGLGVEVTGKQQRAKVMRAIDADFRDPPSKGDASARLDKINEMRARR